MKKRTPKITQPVAKVYPARKDGLREEAAATGSPYTVLVVANGQPANNEQIIAMTKHMQEQQARLRGTSAAPSMPQPSTTTKESTMAKATAPAAPAAPATPAPKKGALKFGAPASAPTKPAKATKDVGDPSKHHSANAKPAKAAAAAAPAKTSKAAKPPVSPAKAAKAAAVANGSYKVASNPTKSGMSKDFLDAAGKLKKFNRDELLAKGGTKACGGDAARAARFFSYFVTKGVFVPA